MNLNAALLITLPAFIGTGAYVLSDADVLAIRNGATDAVAMVQQQHDADLVRAATLMYQIHYNTAAVPSLAQLIQTGYIDPRYLTRELVDATPLTALPVPPVED